MDDNGVTGPDWGHSEVVFGTDRRIRFGPLLPDEDTSSKHIPLWHLPQPTRLFYVFTLCVFL